MQPKTINPQDLEQLRATRPGLLIMDVRTPAEFNELRATPARLMPLDKLDVEAVRHARRGEEPVYVLCRTGSRASSRALSNVNEQPMTNDTRSSRHKERMSVGSSASCPSRQTR